MSEVFSCDDKDVLVAYLYGEIDADGRREVDRHLRGCAACAREVEGLQAVRHDLEAWMPPEPELGFTIVQKPATVLRPGRWALPASMPAWARVAAAVLVIAAGTAIANLQVRYGNDGLSVTTGWMTATPPAPTQPAVVPAEDWRPVLTALERDLRSELAQMKRVDSPDVAVPTAAPASSDTAAILRRVQALLDESEQRQRQELAFRMTQFRREVDLTRQADLLRIDRSFGTLQDRAFRVQAGQQDLMNLMRRASVQQPNP